MIQIKTDVKTIEISVYFSDVDVKKYSVHRYILPRLLISHTNKIKSKKEMSKRLENLYGAQLIPRLERIGNLSVLSMTLSIVNPKIVNDEKLLDEALDIFNQVLFEHDHFDPELFQIEKKNIIETWEILKDRKRSYASYQFSRLLFEGDSMGYPISGTLSDIKKLNVEAIDDYYHQVFLKQPKRIIVNGKVSDLEIEKIKSLPIDHEPFNFKLQTSFRKPRELVFKKEETKMNQAIIKMGYILQIFRYDALYPAACLFETILGGYPESRLFLEIREKQGLCYDIGASYEPYKGVLTISSGVDIKKMDFAQKEIENLISDMIVNGVTELELEHAKAYYIHQLKSSIDDMAINTKRAFLNEITHQHETIEKRMQAILSVTLDDMKLVGHMITLDTIYILHGEVK